MYFKDKRKRDVDNHLKSLLDSLEGIMFVDDSQIYEIIARKTIGCPENRTVISLAEL
jgi:Holliday junction resolvase RusA-like endonuclease